MMLKVYSIKGGERMKESSKGDSAIDTVLYWNVLLLLLLLSEKEDES
jgi:hypothetical protein